MQEFSTEGQELQLQLDVAEKVSYTRSKTFIDKILVPRSTALA
jgi:hypothetical protein